MNIYTGTFRPGTPLVISNMDYVVRMSIKANGGTVTILGSSRFQSANSQAITLEDGQSVTLDAQSLTVPISGVTITPGTGSADVLIAFG